MTHERNDSLPQASTMYLRGMKYTARVAAHRATMASQLRKGTVQLKVLRTEKKMLFPSTQFYTIFAPDMRDKLQQNPREAIIISDNVYTECSKLMPRSVSNIFHTLALLLTTGQMDLELLF